MHLKCEKLLICDGLEMSRDAIAQRVCVFKLSALAGIPLLFSEAQQKVTSASGGLRDLCDSREAPRGGMQARAVNPCLNNNELISKYEKPTF